MLSRLIQGYGLVSKGLDRLAVVATVLLIMVFTGVVLLQIFMRYVVQSPFRWPEELSRFALVWMTFISASCALRRAQHVGIDVLVERIPWPRLRALVKLVGLVLILVLLGYMIRYGIILAGNSANLRSPALGVSYTWLHTGFVIGSILMFVQALDLALRALHAALDPKAHAEDEPTLTSSEML